MRIKIADRRQQNLNGLNKFLLVGNSSLTIAGFSLSQSTSMTLSDPNRAPSKQALNSIQHLRGIAALLVVSVHAHHLAVELGIKSSLLAIFAKYGEVGVDIFFVLSGFLMIYTTKSKEPGLATALGFMRARIVRIVPMYWLLTIVYACVLFILPSLFNQHRFVLHHVWTSLLFIPSYNSAGEALPVIYTGWTLNYEMFFYVLFAGVLCFTRKCAFPVIASAFVILALLGLGEPKNLLLHVYTSPLLLEFVAGGAIALAYAHGKALPWRVALLCLAVGVALIPSLNSEALHRAVYYGIPAALILFGALSLDKAGKWFRAPVLHAVGDSSYSLYLTHVFTLPIIGRLVLKLGAPGALPPTIVGFGIVAMCAVVGYVAYVVIEKRLTKLSQPKASHSKSLRAHAAG